MNNIILNVNFPLPPITVKEVQLPVNCFVLANMFRELADKFGSINKEQSTYHGIELFIDSTLEPMSIGILNLDDIYQSVMRPLSFESHTGNGRVRPKSMPHNLLCSQIYSKLTIVLIAIIKIKMSFGLQGHLTDIFHKDSVFCGQFFAASAGFSFNRSHLS